MPKSKKQQELEQKVEELTTDLQRLRADFENYRKRVAVEKTEARQQGEAAIILKLLPTIDNIERATVHLPKDLESHPWAQGVAKLSKSLEQSLAGLSIQRIDASPGTPFNPELHEAIQMEDGEGSDEVIAEELQAGYTFNGSVIRHSMVKVKRTGDAKKQNNVKKVISEELAKAEETEPREFDRGED